MLIGVQHLKTGPIGTSAFYLHVLTFSPGDVQNESMPVHFGDIQAAATKIEGHAKRTPVHTSAHIDSLVGAEVFLKCENFQRTGSFKFRGAYNALSRLDSEQRSRGVLTFSSGNHAQALACAGRLLNVAVTIVMPHDAPRVKREATAGYGGNIVLYDRDETSREALGAKLAHEQGLTVIPPYDHEAIIAGQGTSVMELVQDTGPLDFLFVPCGGGGLLSGSAVSAKALSPTCQIIGVEPENADDGAQSFRTGQIVTVENPVTIADGARTPSLGKLTFDIIKTHVHNIVTVSDDDLLSVLKLVWERTKLVIEPTGVLGVAALLSGQTEVKDARVGVVLSGGNIDVSSLSALLAEAKENQPDHEGPG